MEENIENQNENVEIPEISEEQRIYNEKAEKFSLWMQENDWNYDEPSKLYMNIKQKKIVSVQELVEIYKNEIAPIVIQPITEIKTNKTKKIKQLPETEGAEKLLKHKYKGLVKRYDIDPKKKTLFKHVILYDSNGDLQEEYCFQTTYNVIKDSGR